MKELKSFFENGVWLFEPTREADPERTLTNRIILKWSKNESKTPKAKARLVVRGCADMDALKGELTTTSPASTRLSSCIAMLVFMIVTIVIGHIEIKKRCQARFLQVTRDLHQKRWSSQSRMTRELIKLRGPVTKQSTTGVLLL